ncbi:MAG: Dabb family protein [Zoogloeaceae bacterium]|nr:Dabb family protein [Zoogloeaceae bacterium]
MIHHLVLFRILEDDAARACRELGEALDRLGMEVDSLATAWRHGPNSTPDAEASDYALLAEFADRGALETYFVHPAHMALLEGFAGRVALAFADLAALGSNDGASAKV